MRVMVSPQKAASLGSATAKKWSPAVGRNNHSRAFLGRQPRASSAMPAITVSMPSGVEHRLIAILPNSVTLAMVAAFITRRWPRATEFASRTGH